MLFHHWARTDNNYSCLIFLVLPFVSSFHRSAEPWLLVQIRLTNDVCRLSTYWRGDFRAFLVADQWGVLLSCIWVSKVRSNHVKIFLLKRNFDFLWFSVKLRFLISRMWTQITLKNDRKLYHCGLIALERHVKSWF